MSRPTIGVLDLQGDVREHLSALEAVRVGARRVRRPEDLADLSGIVLPGGESTTLTMLLVSAGLWTPLAERLSRGFPAFGTCAGLVLLASRVQDGRPDQRSFRALDCVVRRNGFGRQAASFETVLAGAPDSAGPSPAPASESPAPALQDLPAVFIRAPLVESVGPEVEVLAWLAGRPDGRDVPVMVRQGTALATAFHPELTGDLRVHALFRDLVIASIQAVRVQDAGGAATGGASTALGDIGGEDDAVGGDGSPGGGAPVGAVAGADGA